MQKLIYWIAPIYTMLIAYGSLSSSRIPPVNIDHIDKGYHGIAYLLMTIFWYIFFYHRFLERQIQFDYNVKFILSQWSSTIVIAAALFSLVIGGLLELGQGFISHNRSMDAFDLLANTAGIIIAVIILKLLSFTLGRR